MALSKGERARLGKIEAELTRADPRLAARFGRWRSSAPGAPTPAGWSLAPAWMLVAFLVAFCTWTLAPWIGSLVFAVFAIWGFAAQRTARKNARQNAEGDTGWWYRPIDRW